MTARSCGSRTDTLPQAFRGIRSPYTSTCGGGGEGRVGGTKPWRRRDCCIHCSSASPSLPPPTHPLCCLAQPHTHPQETKPAAPPPLHLLHPAPPCPVTAVAWSEPPTHSHCSPMPPYTCCTCLQMVQHARRGPPRANVGKLPLHVPQRALHLPAGGSGEMARACTHVCPSLCFPLATRSSHIRSGRLIPPGHSLLRLAHVEGSRSVSRCRVCCRATAAALLCLCGATAGQAPG